VERVERVDALASAAVDVAEVTWGVCFFEVEGCFMGRTPYP